VFLLNQQVTCAHCATPFRNRQPLCRLADMADKKEQQIHWQAALWAIGRVLSNEFECKEEVPDRMRQLLAELEAKGKRNKESEES
jgi:hypothetical protein